MPGIGCRPATTRYEIAETSSSSMPSTIPGYAWSGKQFSQEYEFSFDYVRFRKGINNSTVLPAEQSLYRAVRRYGAADQREGELRSQLLTGAARLALSAARLRPSSGERTNRRPRSSSTARRTFYGQTSPTRQEHGAGPCGEPHGPAAGDDVSLPHEVGG